MKTLHDLSPALPGQAGRIGSILVVDDEGAVRRFAMRVLESEGYTVFEARDGVEALEMVRDHLVLVHAVVSDIVMPRLNGVELMHALSTSHPSLPVILMSAYATAALKELGIESPCAVLPKPFTSERLIEVVHRCVKRPG